VEAMGYSGPDIDAELILMTARLWKLLDLPSVELHLNTIGAPEARLRHRARLIAHFEQHLDVLDEEAKRRLHSNPLRILDSKNPAMQAVVEAAPRLADDLDEASGQHFETLQSLLTQAGIAFTLNHRLVRGLDYYNATVFEWVTQDLGAQGTICGGGRYDGLIPQLGGKPTPAAGFAMGLERLLALRQEKNGPMTPPPADVYLASSGEGVLGFTLEVAERLRDLNCKVIFHAGGGSFKSQLKRADGSGAAVCIIVGETEAQARQVTCKPLRGQGEQFTLDLEQMLSQIVALTHPHGI